MKDNSAWQVCLSKTRGWICRIFYFVVGMRLRRSWCLYARQCDLWSTLEGLETRQDQSSREISDVQYQEVNGLVRETISVCQASKDQKQLWEATRKKGIRYLKVWKYMHSFCWFDHVSVLGIEHRTRSLLVRHFISELSLYQTPNEIIAQFYTKKKKVINKRWTRTYQGSFHPCSLHDQIREGSLT